MNDFMDYKLTDEDKERIKLLNEISKNKFKNLSLKHLIRLQELVEKKDYSHDRKANRSKKKLLTQINVEIYKHDDAAIWKQSGHLLKSNQLVLSQNIMGNAREKIILIKQLVDTWTMDALIKNEITDEERLDQLLALIVLKKQKTKWEEQYKQLI